MSDLPFLGGSFLNSSASPNTRFICRSKAMNLQGNRLSVGHWRLCHGSWCSRLVANMIVTCLPSVDHRVLLLASLHHAISVSLEQLQIKTSSSLAALKCTVLRTPLTVVDVVEQFARF